jgi:hypothetical protein
MACLHGKAASFNLLEGIYANAVPQEVERLCVEFCNGCQAVILVKDNMTAS